MWTVTIYRDNGYSTENYSKDFEDREDAEIFFADEVKYEFEEEMENGVVSDQEIQNIINNSYYIYENDSYHVNITLEIKEDIDEDDIL